MSFPNTTLESILELKSKHQLYHDFILYLQHTYCLENILFYQDVQDYRSRPTLKKYQLLLARYILVNSPHEINIPCDMRESLITSDDQIQQDTFDQAAESILELIRANSFLPWWYERSNCSSGASTFNTNRRNTLAPSLSVPEHRWQHMFSASRPSFTSLRDVELLSSSSSGSKKEKGEKGSIGGLFSRKRQALIYRVKRTFVLEEGRNSGFSWLAKK